MRCPSLSKIPPPPSGKTCWPWTEETPQLSDTIYPVECKAYSTGMPSVLCSLPKIRIVTLSYDQGQFIEETTRSVLLQGYPNLEYMSTIHELENVGFLLIDTLLDCVYDLWRNLLKNVLLSSLFQEAIAYLVNEDAVEELFFAV